MSRCPTPRKRKHRSRRAAERELFGLWTKRGTVREPASLHTYKCPCGSWHVGHMKEKP